MTARATPPEDTPESRRRARPWTSRRPDVAWRTALRSSTVQGVGIAVVCTVASWMPVDLAPTTGLDPSWQAGLSMAFVHHLAWGPRIDFTYGPLGFISQPVLFFFSTAAASMLYTLALRVATFALLVSWSRTTFPLPLAVLVSYVVGASAVALIDPGDFIMVPVTLFAMRCVARPDARRWQIGIAVLGVAAAAGMLEKLSDGIVAAVLLAAVVGAGHGRTRVADGAVALAAFCGTILLLWVATGNAVRNLGLFLGNALAISDGYAGALQLEIGRTDEWWYALVAVLVIATFGALSLWRTRGRVRIASVVVVGAVAWWAFKEGFVRHDAHDLIFFGFVPILLLVLPLPTARWRPHLAGAVAFLTVIAWTAAGAVPSNVLAVASDAHGFQAEASTILGARSRASTIAAARTAMRLTYHLDPVQLGQLADRTVAVEPWETAVAWAYPSIRWDPEPVFQAYLVYTPALDELDAAFLRSAAAPSRILEQPPIGSDGQDPFLQPPTTWVTMMCHYTQLSATAQWQVLQRVPDRCGALRLVARVRAAFGQTVAVPPVPAPDAVVARFVGLPLSFGYRVSSTLLKAPTTSLVSSAGTFRFILATGGDLHLLRPGAWTGYSAPFAPSSIGWLALTGAGVPPGTGRYEVDFYSLRVARS